MNAGRIFEQSAAYYDELYRARDAQSEVDFVIRELGLSPGSCLLELGCGTGTHALVLAAKGMKICATDRSCQMIAVAEQKLASLPAVQRDNCRLIVSDAAELELNETFAAVISLFHVLSYQVEQEQFEAFFRTTARHLSPGGKFLFDFWHAPAVQKHGFKSTCKRATGSNGELIERTAVAREPIGGNSVDIDISFVVSAECEPRSVTFREVHSMRFFSLAEISQVANLAGLKIERSGQWLSGKPLDDDTWGAFIAGVRV